MELTSLTVLVDILDAGNLSQAARNLKMTRANVSYHLHQLEKSVGVQLVRRTTRRVEPTEVGLRLYAHGRAIQNEMLAARETIATLGQGLQGRVGLSVPSGYGQMVMSDWLIDFKRLYPGIVLDVRFENRVDDLIRDEVDIAIRVMPEPPPTLVARDLGSVRYIACASRAYAEAQGLPQTFEALRAAPVITSGVVGKQLRLRGYQGEQRQEVLLSMPSDPLPTAEYVQAYCDLWRRGRHENVLVAPVEQDEAKSRAHRDRKRLFSARSAAGGGLDVLVLVLRGLSLEHSRRALSRTLGHLRLLNASGHYTCCCPSSPSPSPNPSPQPQP